MSNKCNRCHDVKDDEKQFCDLCAMYLSSMNLDHLDMKIKAEINFQQYRIKDDFLECLFEASFINYIFV